MTYPESLNLDDIYGVGAENADAGIDSIEGQIEAVSEMLYRADGVARTITDAGKSIGALIIACSGLVEIIREQQAQIERLQRALINSSHIQTKGGIESTL